MIDLSPEPVVDDHCHAFLPSKETEYYERYFTLSMVQVPASDLMHTFLYRQTIKELSRVLRVRGTPSEVVKARQETYKKNPGEYIRLLFQDAKLDTLLIDEGYPTAAFTGYSIELDDFQKLVPCKLRRIYRIDPTIMGSVKAALPFEELVRRLSAEIENSVRHEGAVAVKSIVAYFSGLEVKEVSDTEARKAYSSLVSEVKTGKNVLDVFASRSPSSKAVCDYFVFLSAKKSVELKVPFQIHVGIGDAPLLDLRRSNPLDLYDLIGAEELAKGKIVLVHTGYPYVEEAGFLANCYPNVYIDLSEMIPFASIGIKDKLLKLFEMAPTSKIMYGSDGWNLPELFWISAVETKRALSAALNELVASKTIDEEWALEVGKQILSENAKRVYRL